MEFNERSHEPTFRIISGLPGDSHALETAKRMKILPSIIKRAQSYLGTEMLQMSSIIKSLEEKRRLAEDKERALDQQRLQLVEQQRKADLKQLQLQQQEQLLRQQQIGDLSRFIADKRGELENLVAELRQGEITRKKTKAVKTFIASLEEQEHKSQEKVRQLDSLISTAQKQGNAPLSFEIGMDVLVGKHRREGRIVRKERDGSFVVAIGPMKFPVKAEDLKPSSKAQRKASIRYDSPSVTAALELDVRGLTLQESLEKVARQIDAALVQGMQSFSVIHGMGDGILSRGIHDYLAKQRQVSAFYYAKAEDGGFGKTYIEL
jgi:DNA mismatch repair protein MutS2